jgi:AraC family transcriptional activator of pobA
MAKHFRQANKATIPTLNISSFTKLHLSTNAIGVKPGHISSEDFLVQRLEDTVQTIKLPIPHHRKTVYDFILVTDGMAERTFGLVNYALKSNQIFLMPSNQITSTNYISPDIKGYYCHFTKEFLEGLIPLFDKLSIFDRNLPVVDLSVDHIASLGDKLEELVLLSERNLSHKKTQLALALLGILFEIENLVPESTFPRLSNAAERITAEFKKLVNERIRSCHKVSEYADLLHISPNHLNKCVKAVSGISANQWILDVLLLESKALLIQPNLSIADISFTLGFDDPSYFSRFIKAGTGLSPLVYRKKYFNP